MRRQRRQAVRIQPASGLRLSTSLRHLVLLFSLALAATTTTVRAADEAAAGWTAEFATARSLGPAGRTLAEFPGQLRLPARSHPLLAGLTVQSATAGLRGGPEQGVPFYQIALGSQPDADQPIQVLVYGASGARLFPSFGVGPDRPEGCGESARYCTEDLYAAGAPTAEMFYGLRSAAGDEARVVHIHWRDRESWTALLYNRSADLVQGITVHDDSARQIGATGLSPANVDLAQRLVELVASFEPAGLPLAAEPSKVPPTS
jgi:hypothetical protein